VGLAVNRDGFPLAHEVMAGNRHDSTTLDQMLAALDRRVGLREGQTVVVDRGMSGEENLKKILGRGLHYLVASPYSERQEWVEEFRDAAEFEGKRQSNPSVQAPALVMQWKGGRTSAGSGSWATPESRGS
jgi:transposase